MLMILQKRFYFLLTYRFITSGKKETVFMIPIINIMREFMTLSLVSVKRLLMGVHFKTVMFCRIGAISFF